MQPSLLGVELNSSEGKGVKKAFEGTADVTWEAKVPQPERFWEPLM